MSKTFRLLFIDVSILFKNNGGNRRLIYDINSRLRTSHKDKAL